MGQLAATAAFAVGIAWLLTLWVAGGSVPTPTWEVPLLGAVPVPTLLVVGGLAGWFLLGRLLSWHAGSLGARWADGIGRGIDAGVAEVVRETVEAPLAERDAARRALWQASREVGRG